MVSTRRAPGFALAVIAFHTCSAGRVEKDTTPYPCRESYEDSEIESWVSKHLEGKAGSAAPHLLLLLGGSGAGKGTFIKRWQDEDARNTPAGPAIDDFIMHGLDEYLPYIPEYQKTLSDTEHVYKDAADSCYTSAARPAAKKAMVKIIAARMNVIYEETGKNLDRIRQRVLPPFVEAGYRVTVVLVHNKPEVAIQRSAGRFQFTGRFAADDYIRGSFQNNMASYLALMQDAEELREAVDSEFVYCDNSGEYMKCFAERDVQDRLVPQPLLSSSQELRYNQEL